MWYVVREHTYSEKFVVFKRTWLGTQYSCQWKSVETFNSHLLAVSDGCRSFSSDQHKIYTYVMSLAMPEPDAAEAVLELFCNEIQEYLPTIEDSPGYLIRVVSMLSFSVLP